jgi:hypothetical protein
LVTPGLAAASFSGLITICFGREGIIDGGTVCFGDFGGGDPDESAGSGGLGISGGSGGCDLSTLPLGEIGRNNSGFPGAIFWVVSACFLLELVFACLT